MNKKIIPNIVTISNLVFGLISLLYTVKGQYKEAALAILFAMVMDGMDGRLARHLKVTSDFGKELDSLSDLVSFGVAPAILVYSKILFVYSYIGLIVAVAFAICGAVRLARFNILNITTHFLGIPITCAGPLLAIFVLISHKIPAMSYIFITVILAYLMVSNIKVPKY